MRRTKRHRLMLVKLYLQRSQNYANLFRNVILVYLACSDFDMRGWLPWKLSWVAPLATVGVVSALWAIGWVEDRLGLWAAQEEEGWSRVPQITEILTILRRLDK